MCDLGFPKGIPQMCQCGYPFMAASRAQYRSGCCYDCFSKLTPTDPRASDTTKPIKLPKVEPRVAASRAA